MNDVVEYRAYIVGRDGVFIGRHEFLADDDDAAIEQARQFVDGHDVEVWSGARFIFRLQAAN